MERVHNRADLIIAKQRHGPTGTIPLFFEAEFTRFGNLDLDHAYDGHNVYASEPVQSHSPKATSNGPAKLGYDPSAPNPLDRLNQKTSAAVPNGSGPPGKKL
jgi:hypothetical protein